MKDHESVLDYTVEPDETGLRLDAFLAARADRLSRSRLKALIKDGHVRVGARKLDEPNYRVKPGETVEVDLPEPEEATPRPEAIPLAIVYEDDHLVVVDKPAGMVVHPAPGAHDGTLVNALLHHCGDTLSGIGGIRRPGIVHRLDKDTSGLLVIAKNDVAHRDLSAQFADHGREGPLKREYCALVWGVPQLRAGSVDAPLDRDTKNREKRAVRRSGRHAVTHYRVEETFENGLASLVTCRLETGRTHQIRVHMAHIGHPLLGDALYGSGFQSKVAKLPADAADALRALFRQALHARSLGFRHPETGETVLFHSDLPSDFETLLNALRKPSEALQGRN
ncbi:RluA family pseudouridine synthase [Afifella marina]|uniref:Pseudouridine synthase n=1 Tax=Afifella marina DSM 2698 TaxID=1120955 RepID=A0A1G5P6J3_AFIMA|nr:RluA family pseudouridine synthase [Afifella marina]MBK1625106.1 RluA family pseudouridine synthase [Afifella marina DSM 2698]MBK1627010.1 RluA family pseudouridine synthase [Afifella marina]MBK5919347.1 RNA pseudouridine synthase [Afifella marina]RAI19574.1 RNA pseudouridine synthase [Afifella marina DSM 2698]SCZ44630.1 23S rRNA pseudouridine1911/1915/1917 synthase [Afifella marina DSM 2698]